MKKLDVFQQQRPVKTLKTAIVIIFIKYSNSLHKFLVKQPLHMFYKIGVLVFSKFTREHLYWGLFFNKTSDFIKKEALAQVLSCEFCKIFKNTFFTEICCQIIFCFFQIAKRRKMWLIKSIVIICQKKQRFLGF